MTREEAKEMFRNDKDSYGKPRGVMGKIDKIYDEFEGESLAKAHVEKVFEKDYDYIEVYRYLFGRWWYVRTISKPMGEFSLKVFHRTRDHYKEVYGPGKFKLTLCWAPREYKIK